MKVESQTGKNYSDCTEIIDTLFKMPVKMPAKDLDRYITKEWRKI